LTLSILALALVPCALLPGNAEVLRKENGALSKTLNIPLYEWSDADQKAKGVVVAVHGLIKYGGVFDCLGKHLAGNGFIVVAPDMRGYGHWQDDCREKSEHKISYDKSYQDLVALTTAMHNQYPKLPIFCIGESLGADLVIHLSAEHANLTNGLILASPAIEHYHFVNSYTIEQVLLLASNPDRQVNLVPYIKTVTSEDPQIVSDSLKDPMERKSLTVWDLLRSRKLMRSTLSYADAIPSNVPVLIIQGSADRLIKAKGAFVLASHLHSTDQTVRWLAERGHILLETSHVPPSTLDNIDSWLTQHSQPEYIMQADVPGTNTSPIQSD
jgi:alpha-beta hydrolase superfamily lysophospholipase